MADQQSIVCSFCNHEFSQKSALTLHLKTARYCLSLQGKQPKMDSCEYCGKDVSRRGRESHIASCEEKMKTDLRNDLHSQFEKEKQVLVLQYTKIIAEKEALNQYLERELFNYRKYGNISNCPSSDEVTSTNLQSQLDSCIQNQSPPSYLMKSSLELNGHSIPCRHPDRYIEVSSLCTAGGKNIKDWLRLDSSKELIQALTSATSLETNDLMQKEENSVWMHPDLAIQLARWISTDFGVRFSKWIREQSSDGQSIDVALFTLQKRRLEQMEVVCASKKPREVFPEENVVYILTNEDAERKRIYIIGKSTSLANRLGTYNKTCEHKVVYYKSCGSEDLMNKVEKTVLMKLDGHRQQANRDRFILPANEDISFFTKIIEQVLEFYSS